MKNTIITAAIALAIGLALGNLSRKNTAMADAARTFRDSQQIDFTQIAIETDNGTKFGRVLAVRTEDEQGAATVDKKNDISDTPDNLGRLIGTVNGKPMTIVVEW
jgi:hypothetical protein